MSSVKSAVGVLKVSPSTVISRQQIREGLAVVKKTLYTADVIRIIQPPLWMVSLRWCVAVIHYLLSELDKKDYK